MNTLSPGCISETDIERQSRLPGWLSAVPLPPLPLLGAMLLLPLASLELMAGPTSRTVSAFCSMQLCSCPSSVCKRGVETG